MDFKERFYLILAGIFIASLVSCNLIFQKFFTWSPFGIYTFEISVGILPYPITFLATDLISEISLARDLETTYNEIINSFLNDISKDLSEEKIICERENQLDSFKIKITKKILKNMVLIIKI